MSDSLRCGMYKCERAADLQQAAMQTTTSSVGGVRVVILLVSEFALQLDARNPLLKVQAERHAGTGSRA
jgi:hypothetical protein